MKILQSFSFDVDRGGIPYLFFDAVNGEPVLSKEHTGPEPTKEHKLAKYEYDKSDPEDSKSRIDVELIQESLCFRIHCYFPHPEF